MKSKSQNAVMTDVPLFIPTQTKAALARLVLRNELGQVIQQWIVKQTKSTLGSASSSTLRCSLPGIAPYHALLVSGSRQTFVRALAPKLSQDGVPVNELLLTEAKPYFELAGHRFEFERQLAENSNGSELTHSGRMKFTLARPFEINPRTSSVKTSPVQSTAIPATSSPDSHSVAKMIKGAIEPIESQIRELLIPLAEMQAEVRRATETRQNNYLDGTTPFESSPASETLAAHTNDAREELRNEIREQLEEIVARQSATIESLGERLSDVNHQLGAIERVVSKEGDIQPTTVVHDDETTQLQRAAVEQLQTGFLSVTAAIKELEERQRAAREENVEWKNEVQSQLGSLTKTLEVVAEQRNEASSATNELSGAVERLKQSHETAQEELQRWQEDLHDELSTIRTTFAVSHELQDAHANAELATAIRELQDKQEQSLELILGWKTDILSEVHQLRESLQQEVSSVAVDLQGLAQTQSERLDAFQAKLSERATQVPSAAAAATSESAIEPAHELDQSRAIVEPVAVEESSLTEQPTYDPGLAQSEPTNSQEEIQQAGQDWASSQQLTTNEPAESEVAVSDESDSQFWSTEEQIPIEMIEPVAAASDELQESEWPTVAAYEPVATIDEVHDLEDDAPTDAGNVLDDLAAWSTALHHDSKDEEASADWPTLEEQENSFQEVYADSPLEDFSVLATDATIEESNEIAIDDASADEAVEVGEEAELQASLGLEAMWPTIDEEDPSKIANEDEHQEEPFNEHSLVEPAASDELEPNRVSSEAEFFGLGMLDTEDAQQESDPAPSSEPFKDHASEFPAWDLNDSAISTEDVSVDQAEHLFDAAPTDLQDNSAFPESNYDPVEAPDSAELPSWWVEDDGNEPNSEGVRDGFTNGYHETAEKTIDEVDPLSQEGDENLTNSQLDYNASRYAPEPFAASAPYANGSENNSINTDAALESSVNESEDEPAFFGLGADADLSDDDSSQHLEDQQPLDHFAAFANQAAKGAFPSEDVSVSNVDAEVSSVDPLANQPTTEATPGEEDDDSVEEYMRNLLARMRGEPETDRPSPTPKPVPAPAPKPSSDTVQAESVAERAVEPAPVEVAPEFDPDSYRPSTLAPERNKNLAALRDLANNSARTAINKSTRQRHLSGILLKLAIAAIGLTVSAVLIAINGFAVNIGLVATFASLLVALIWGYDAIGSLKPLLQASIVLTPSETVEEQVEEEQV